MSKHNLAGASDLKEDLEHAMDFMKTWTAQPHVRHLEMAFKGPFKGLLRSFKSRKASKSGEVEAKDQLWRQFMALRSQSSCEAHPRRIRAEGGSTPCGRPLNLFEDPFYYREDITIDMKMAHMVHIY